MAKLRLSVCGALALLGAVCAPLAAANAATLTGDTIHGFYLFPNTGTVNTDLGTFTAPGGGQVFGELSYMVSGTQISITNLLDVPVAFMPPSSFNGFEFVDVSTDPGINGITLDPSTTAPVNISVATFTSNSVFLNFQGQTWDAHTAAVFDLQFGSVSSVPVPAALPLFATGLAGLGLLGWRRKKKAAT
jgi:hypothetical protein